MRTITIGPDLLRQLLIDAPAGADFVDVPIAVAWPELHLAPEQRRENTLAILGGGTPPHADPGVFLLRIPIVTD